MKKNRIVPDTIKSLAKKSQLIIRNPKATRPWRHVLEPISGYLILTTAMYFIMYLFFEGQSPGERYLR